MRKVGRPINRSWEAGKFGSADTEGSKKVQRKLRNCIAKLGS